MKKHLSLLLALCLLLTLVPVKAEAAVIDGGTFDDNLQWSLDDQGTLTISGSGGIYSYSSAAPWSMYREDIVLVIIEEGVTSIGDSAFANCVNLLEVWLPESLEKMGFNVFEGCNSLQGLIIPPKVKEMTNTFQDSTNLQYIVFTGHAPNMNFSSLRGIGGMVFYPINYKSWTREVLQECVGTMTWMGYESEYHPDPYLFQVTFADNSTWSLAEDYTLTLSGMREANESISWSLYEDRITRIVLEEGITHIAPNTFHVLTNLREVSIPSTVTTIGGNSFGHCTALRGIILPDSVTEIKTGAFRSCYKLSYIRLPANLTSIESHAFAGTGLRYLELPEEMQIIPMYLFRESSLQAINLPDGLQSIEDYAFSETSLRKIVIPASVTSIGDNAISYGPLDSIYFLGDPPYISNRAFLRVTATAYYPADNPAWTEEVLQNYGGEITWVACDHVHNYVAEVTLATCTTAGSATYTCADCGDSFVQPLDDALGHDFVEATCTQAKYCQNYGCGYTEGKPLGHNILPATCTMFGYCQNDHCGRIVSDPLGHQWDDANATVKTCTVCGEKEGYYRINLDPELVGETDYAWIDGVPYYLYYDGEYVFTALDHADATNLVLYYYNDLYAEDLHTQYPTGMKVWMLDCSSGDYEATYVKEFDDLLQYAGSSIRITGKKGIRMITSITKSNKQALTGKGLAGYKLVEYGTALAWVSDLADGHYLTLGEATTKSNYAYKRGVADPVFKDTGSLVQYTNVLVGFTNDQCAPDIAMRPYIIVEDASGKRVTIYGGTVYRSIAYIAYQNRKAFGPGTSSYEYVWSIIHHVYGNRFDQDYKK